MNVELETHGSGVCWNRVLLNYSFCENMDNAPIKIIT
jgi:hypothetical protein